MAICRGGGVESGSRTHPDFALRPRLQRRRNRPAVGDIARHHRCEPVPIESALEEMAACFHGRQIMKREPNTNLEEILEQNLGMFKSPPKAAMDAGEERIAQRLSASGPAVRDSVKIDC